jgi:hypothetical protein
MQEGRKAGNEPVCVRQLLFLPSCFPAFLIYSWAAYNRQLGVDGIQ